MAFSCAVSGGLSRVARLDASALGDVGFEHAEREIARPGISRQLPLAAALPRTDPQIFAALFAALAGRARDEGFAASGLVGQIAHDLQAQRFEFDLSQARVEGSKEK